MSLADELLADFEELQQQHNDDFKKSRLIADKTQASNDTAMDSANSVFSDLLLIWGRPQLKSVLERIDYFKKSPVVNHSGAIEQHPEYELIVEGNSISVEIDSEIDRAHKKFSELESLVVNPLEYARTVKCIGNQRSLALLDTTLRSIIPPAKVMVVTLTFTTTKCQQLTDAELAAVMEACDTIEGLVDTKIKIIEFVESRMSIIAPNLSIVVGSTTAAQLMGSAGGLVALSKIPSCNLPMVGSTKSTLAGFSTATVGFRAGYMFQSDFIQRTPTDYRTRAMRIFCAKASLAARVDASHEYSDGSAGRSFRLEIEQKLDKMQEPPPAKEQKALAAPDQQQKKKRGGKRARKEKEKYAVTELQKQQNRMAFGKAELEVLNFDEMEGLGMVGTSLGTGNVRAAGIDVRTKAKAKQVKKQNTTQLHQSGLSSSLVFTPVQGLEIVNSALANEAKLKTVNEKWFSANAQFGANKSL